jgi:hypothetical protein
MDADRSVRAWLRRRWALVLGVALLCTVPRALWLDQWWGGDFDLGIYHNLCWNLSEGRGFRSDVLARNHLGEHASPIVALFAPLYAIHPTALWLVLVQGAAVAAVALAALWYADARLATVPPARARAGRWIALALVLGYGPLWAAWQYDPQPVVYGAAGLALALVAVERRRWAWAWAGLLLCLSSRESAALAGLGLAWWTWRRAGAPRHAAAMALLSLAWAAIAMLWLMPLMRDGAGWAHTARLDPLGEPGAKALYATRLLGQDVAALPGALLNLATGYPPQLSSMYHYDAQIAPFMLLAAMGGLARALAQLRPWPWLVPLLAIALAWGALPPLRHLVILADPQRRADVTATAAELRAVLATIPADAPLAADPQLGPLLCLRQGYRPLRGSRDEGDAAHVAALAPGTWIIVQRWWWRQAIPQPPSGLETISEGDRMIVLRRSAD